jgi:hypothetical protein
MDRNVGDYMNGAKAGTKYDPTKKGLSYATYIHGEDLSGILIFKGMDVVHPCFTWEINETPYGGTFWNVTNCSSISKLNPRTKVGWRGPAITLENAQKHLPKTVTHYDTWWDDYMVWRYMDFLNMK